MRKRSFKRVLGWSVASVAVTGFVAAGAFAEPPSHGFNSRPPVEDIQHPHKPHAQHKAPPAMAPNHNDHTPHVVVNVPAGSPKVGVVHTHKQISVVPVTGRTHPSHHTPVPVTIIQVPHHKTFKIH